MTEKKLPQTIQNTTLAKTLERSKTQLSVTQNLLQKVKAAKALVKQEDDSWIDRLYVWADNNIIQDSTNFPKNKATLLNSKRISLRWNRLSTVPKELFNLYHLEVLELNNNSIESLPEGINKLVNLKELNLNVNKLRCLPKTIVELTELEVIKIKNNKHLELSEEQSDWLKELLKQGRTVIYDKYNFKLGE